jgi:ketosteroid isomerase-like protein
MQSTEDFFIELYDNFNSRRIEKVITQMAENVKWANGMEGGFVYGHDGVREYWLRQFKLISSRVTPLKISQAGNKVVIDVRQVVHDTEGKLLMDEQVRHIFTLENGKVSEFEIGHV